MADVPDALGEIRSPDQRGVAEFPLLLGSDDFRVFLSELTQALETRSDPARLKQAESMVSRADAV
jgi:hypothetical protein